MKLEHLRQTIAIEQHKSITKAAKALYIGQPALCNTLYSLEKEIGVQIFTRNIKGVEPTEDGKKILEIIHRIVNDCNLILDYGNQNDPEKMTGTIKVSISPTYGYLYFDILSRYKDTFPNVDFQLSFYSADRIKDALRRGECSIAVELEAGEMVDVIRDEKFACEKLKAHKVMLFAGPKSPFYDRESVTIEEL